MPDQSPVWTTSMGDPKTEDQIYAALNYYLDLATNKYLAAAAMWNRSAELKNKGNFKEAEQLDYEAQEIHDEGEHAEHVDAERILGIRKRLTGR